MVTKKRRTPVFGGVATTTKEKTLTSSSKKNCENVKIETILDNLKYTKVKLLSGKSVDVAITYMTPEDAQKIIDAGLLDKQITSVTDFGGNKVKVYNRKAYHQLIERYTELMNSGKWHFTGQPLQFTETQACFNGRHTIEALAKANKGVVIEVLIESNLPGDIYWDIDIPKTRSEGDNFGSFGSLHPTRCLYTTQKLKCLNESDGTTTRIRKFDKMPARDGFMYITEHGYNPVLLDNLVSMEMILKKSRTETKDIFPLDMISSTSMFLIYTRNIPEEKVKEFWDLFFNYEGYNVNKPEFDWLNSAREHILSKKHSCKEKFQYLCWFVNSFLQGKKITTFKLKCDHSL